jgi:hypothetical protein
MKQIAAAALTALSLAACATQPEPCTAEWVDWKTERVYSEFRKANRQQLDAMQDLNAALTTDGTGAGLLTLARLAPGVVGMINSFVRETVPEVQSAVAQCGNAPGASKLLADFLRQEGVSERAVDAIERFGLTLETDA